MIIQINLMLYGNTLVAIGRMTAFMYFRLQTTWKILVWCKEGRCDVSPL